MISRLLNLIIFKSKNPSCSIHLNVRVSRKSKVGENCKLGFGSSISSTVNLGKNVIIGEGTKLRNITIGDNSMIESGVRVVGPGNGEIQIGNECYIGVNNILDTSDNITIGNFVHIAGPSTGLWCHSSAKMCLNSIPLNDTNRAQYRPTGEIIIEDNVYIGGNSTIYPGVKISSSSIVTPNSAITKNIESNLLVGGVPAVIIKKLDDIKRG